MLLKLHFLKLLVVVGSTNQEAQTDEHNEAVKDDNERAKQRRTAIP